MLRALEDDDHHVVAWAGYGLGESCKGHEGTYVRALGARLASLGHSQPLDTVATLLRALGRCGGSAAEQTLRAWLQQGGHAAEAAAYGLGDASATHPLSVESAHALLDAAQGTPPLPSALYAFGRSDWTDSADIDARILSAARASLARPGTERIFAVRALAHLRSREAALELARVLASSDFSPAERSDAARSLARFGTQGQDALAGAMTTLVPQRASALMTDGFGVLVSALGSVGADPPKKIEAALWAIARLDPGPAAPPPLTRRVSMVRCAAAAKLARGVWDADVLRHCDIADGEARERATLSSLDREPLLKARRKAWHEFEGSPHVRVREAALEMIVRHPELGDAARSAIAQALSATEPGVVAAAAIVVQAHPE
ncbi:MAG: hypothetical protein ACREJ3_12770, partial [Polyangiaceae bacterium]